MRTGGLALAATLVLIVAGVVLSARHSRPAESPFREPDSTPTPAATGSPTAQTAPSADGHLAPETIAARAYTLAATNWSGITYAISVRRRARLADGSLRRELLNDRELQRELAQLRADRVSRLSAVLDMHSADVEAGRASVLVTVDELHIAAGQRTRQVVRYRLRLHRRGPGWRVTAFGAVASEVGR